MKKNNPKVSVIIPVYNAEKYLEQCLESIKNQTLSDFEVICVNDGSKDGSDRILKSFEKTDKRFKIYNQNNKGVSASKNIGIEKATGEYIYFSVADNWFELNFLEEVYNSITENRGDILLFCANIHKNDNLDYCLTNKHNSIVKNFRKSPFDDVICSQVFDNIWDKVYKRDFLIKNEIKFNENCTISEDICFNILCYFNKPEISFCLKPLYNYRILPDKVYILQKNFKYEGLKTFVCSQMFLNSDAHQKYVALKMILYTLTNYFVNMPVKNLSEFCKYFCEFLNSVKDDNIGIYALFAKLLKEDTEIDFFNPNVSVIIPIHNAEKTLEQCLEGFINQTLSNIEIICINDGSTDNSAEILNSYVQKDKRIKIFNQENEGGFALKNLGIEKARGEYIYFANSNDSVKLEFIEEKYYFALCKKSDVLLFGINYFYNENLEENYENLKNLSSHLFTSNDKLYKRDFIKKNNIKFIDSSILNIDNFFNIFFFTHQPKTTFYYKNFYNSDFAEKNFSILKKSYNLIFDDLKLFITSSQYAQFNSLQKRKFIRYIINSIEYFLNRIPVKNISKFLKCFNKFLKFVKTYNIDFYTSFLKFLREDTEIDFYNPKVSVIFPVYNNPSLLDRYLDRFIAQSLCNIEIICINLCFLDNSQEILNSYMQKDQRIRVFNCKQNDISVAKNMGIEKARGEYIYFYEINDRPEHDLAKKAYESANHSADVLFFNVSCGCDCICNSKDAKIYKLEENLTNSEYLYPYFFMTSDKLYKKEFIKKNNIRFLNVNILNQNNFFNIFCFILNPKISVLYNNLSVCQINEKEHIYYKEKNPNNSIFNDIKILLTSSQYSKIDSNQKDTYFKFIVETLEYVLKRIPVKNLSVFFDDYFNFTEFFKEYDIDGYRIFQTMIKEKTMLPVKWMV